VNCPLTSSPETRAAFDEWLWTLDEDALDRLRLPKLGKAAAAAKVALPQLTFLTVITGSSQPAFKSLVHAAGGTARASRETKAGGLIQSRLGGRDYVVSLWRSKNAGVHHLVASVPVTDSRWRRVEESWLRNAGPRLTPVILNKQDFESVGDALSEHGTVEVSRLTARVLSDHSSYSRGWPDIGFKARPSHRDALRETEGMLVRTLTLRVGDSLFVHLRRHAGATYYSGDFGLFSSVVLQRFTAAAGERLELLSHRERRLHEPVTDALVMDLPVDSLGNEFGRRELLTSVGDVRGVQVATFHQNPYLHFGVTDYLDGSSFDVVVTDDQRLTVLPGYRASVGSLARVTDAIGDALGMVALGSEPVPESIPDEEFIG